MSEVVLPVSSSPCKALSALGRSPRDTRLPVRVEMGISILHPGNISPIHLSLLIPVACLQRKIMTLQGWVLLQTAALEPAMDETGM